MKFAPVSVGALAIALASPAMAQQAPQGQAAPQAEAQSGNGGIQEIVVTAQKRAENVQDVPIAISAFTAAALQERAVTSVSSLSNIAPNVTLDAGTPFSGSSQVLAAYIRGIGANDFAFNIDPGVGIYLDGVYLARSVGANQDLPDVERVEVLKGPQGTLFGRNTIGGAISIVTHDPGDTFRFVGSAMTGSYSLFSAKGTVDMPLADKLSSSLSFAITKRDGYLHRIPYPGANNYTFDPITSLKAAGYGNQGYGTEGGDNTWNLRGKIRYNGATFRATLTGDYSRTDTSQIANKVITTFPAVFAGTYNCAIAGNPTTTVGGVTGPCDSFIGGPPSAAYLYRRGGLNSILDLPAIYGVNTDNNPDNNRLPYDNRFVTNNIDTSYANGNNFNKLKQGGAALTLDFDLSDTASIKSITAYRELHWVVGMDLDGSPLNFLHTSFSMNQKQFSQELQLTGTAVDKKLKYVLGAYYFTESGDLHDYVTFAEGLLQVDGPNNLSTKNYAFYGQVDYALSDLIAFTVGGRYTHEKKEFEGFQSDANGLNYKLANYFGDPNCASLNPISDACRVDNGFPNAGQPLRYYVAGVQHKTFSNFSPKVGVQLHPNQDIMVYASWSKGYKTGGWTTRLSNPLPYAPGFGPEKAETWEAGIKSELLDRHLQINGAVFLTNYNGIQLNFQQGVSPTIQNAGDARIKGFEVELVAAPARGLTITGSLGYTDAKYTSVDGPAQVAPSALQAGVFAGATLPKTPKWKFNVSPRYQADLGSHGTLVFLGDVTFTSMMKNDTEGTFLLDRQHTTVLNGSVTYRAPGGSWELTAGGTNLTNERYLTTGQAQLAGGQIYGTYSRPAEWYARVGVKF
ncbi:MULTISPECIES: TonB-dependent receptor [unclassified Novosphingobium]|uniref:TonB-dependent receptor n=1 Tax=unclassified Novosphingobium TaxID=2644732 RepID=UPI000D30AB37|nr:MULTISPECIES: TonB-dependent receptor [unclassified Novosphingobium]PTR11829.1 iron complex outermembrane receptor protein [Novosphingobium sp. GV055]PUB04869.1 iron complex outermembrane receptor protein [Novosphingobium sp. GV061]PUB21188.1 iron complex outermembrane receptor protein [Novosphingobium sp. GV079]PUB42914.1 iron complex outermembrane receptor protein [Novosphingobium sp. GV027]